MNSNSHFLTGSGVGNIGLNHMKQVRENTISKWDSLGFLEGLKGHVKPSIAELYESEASHLLNETRVEPEEDTEDDIKEDS